MCSCDVWLSWGYWPLSAAYVIKETLDARILLSVTFSNFSVKTFFTMFCPTHPLCQPIFTPFLPISPSKSLYVSIVHWPFKYNSWGGQLRWQLGWSWTWSWWRSRLVWVTLDRVSGGYESCFEGNQMLFSKQFKDHRNRKSLNVCKHKYSSVCGCLPMISASTRVYTCLPGNRNLVRLHYVMY